MFDKTPFFAKTFGGEKCEAVFATSRTFLCSSERGDQALSNGGKHNSVRCLERWQIAVENWKFSEKTLNFENNSGMKGLKSNFLRAYVAFSLQPSLKFT